MKGKWIRQPQGDTAVVFVHGILSSGEACWRNPNGAYWPDLLEKEKGFKDLGIYVFTYSTDIFSGSYSIGDAVDSLREWTRVDHVLDTAKVVLFVCHSMGGIVVRRFMVKYQQILAERQHPIGLFLVASPSLGAKYANWLSSLALLMGHSQAKALRFSQKNEWLNDLDRDFINLKEAENPPFTIRGKELIEDKAIILRKWLKKQVVEPFAGARYFGEPYKVPGSNHFSIAKPEDPGAIQHQLLCRFIEEMPRKKGVSPDLIPISQVDSNFEKEIADYCRKAETLHEKLPLIGFKTNLKVPIDIADIYVPLRAMMDLRATGQSCFADAEDAEEHLRGHGVDSEISVPDAFRQAEQMAVPRRGIVILGDPGSGKTTHLKRVLLWCLRGGPAQLGLPEDMVPVFLPLRELKTTETTLDAFIQEQLSDPQLETPAGFGKRLLDRGSLLFLLDGLDEVADPDQRSLVSRWIRKALTLHRNRNCRFVVTCRFAGYTEEARLGNDFLEMHVRPLDETQAAEFVQNWYRIVETGLSSDTTQAEILAKTKAEELLQRLKQPEFRSRRIFELTRNPLLLTNICLIHQSQGSLPDTRSQLYEECVDVLLEKWRKAIGFPSRVTARTGRRVLQPAAYWLHQKEKRTRASASQLAPIIEPSLKGVNWERGSAADFLRIVRDESGLLTGWSQDQYGFIHLGFQEYLAAREIQRLFLAGLGKSEVLRQLAEKFGQGWWQEVILLLLAQADHCLFDPFMREVLQLPVFAENDGLMQMCLEEAAERTPEPFVELLNLDSAGNPDKLWQRQLAALRILERLDGNTLKDVMNRLKNHPYDKIQQWVGERFKESLQEVIHPDPSKYELVLVNGGTFMMGSEEDDDEKPVHEVTVPDFYIGRYSVTNEEYGRFMQATGHREPKYWADRKFNQSEQPVVGVNWHDAKKFAEWAGLQLPTEAQWEYACRAGTKTRYYWGDEPDCSKANYGNSSYSDECRDVNPSKTSPIGNYPPNPWGLYDMHGNVWQWCEDQYHNTYNGASNDGSSRVDKKESAIRVLRGGAWDGSAEVCRAASRGRLVPVSRGSALGFRLVRLPGQLGEPSKSGKSGK